MVCHLHVQCLFLFAGVMEFDVLRSFDFCKHHEDVGEQHVFFSFDSNLLFEFFSQSVHEAFQCVVIILFVVRIALKCFHVVDGEKWTGSEH